MNDSARPREYVQSFERGLSVLRAFSSEHPAMTLTEAASATGLSPAVVRRFLLTAVHLGYLRTDGKRFAPTLQMLEFGHATLSSMTLPEVAEPHMEHLVQRVGESSSLAVLDGDDIVYVARVLNKTVMNMAISVGTRFPAFPTSMGRVLLAAMPEVWLQDYLARSPRRQLTPTTLTNTQDLLTELELVRRTGHAFVSFESNSRARGLAIPLHGAKGNVIAALNIGAHAHAGDETQVLTDLLIPLQECGAHIEHDIARIGRDLSLNLGGHSATSTRSPSLIETNATKVDERH